MLMTRNAKVLTAALLALGLAACTTTKAPETAAAPTTTAPESSAATTSTSSANTTSSVDSQALADEASRRAQADAAAKANQLASALGLKMFHFDFDSSTVANSDYDALKAHALYLSKNAGAKVRVGGHTDERGSREYNQALGERRAKAVATFLTSYGAKAGQLDVVSYGEEKPLATGDSEEAWAQNRRVELNYTSGNP